MGCSPYDAESKLLFEHTWVGETYCSVLTATVNAHNMSRVIGLSVCCSRSHAKGRCDGVPWPSRRLPYFVCLLRLRLELELCLCNQSLTFSTQ